MPRPKFASDASDPRGHVDAIVRAALDAADPGDALRAAWPDELRGGTWDALAVGKAAGPMLLAADRLCTIDRALCIASPGTVPTFQTLHALAATHEADHPLPTQRNVDASHAAARFVAGARERAAAHTVRGLIFLLSGGASALLTLPAEPLGLEDIRTVTRVLLRSGATIDELNTVRKHLEVLKGGGVARLAAPAPLWTLILSDVIGDELSTIGSGPTCADPTTFADALDVIERHGAADASAPATRLLRDGAAGLRPETLKPRDPALVAARHRIVANNAIAVDAVVQRARELGYAIHQTLPGTSGEARDIGRRLANLAMHVQAGTTRPVAIVLGGETTVTVTGAGTGGRNQELALAGALEIAGHPGITIASFSTDGVDGPTDAAGAVATDASVDAMRARSIDAAAALRNNDSNHAFKAIDGLIRTGPTGTNVNDVAVALVEPGVW